MWIEVTVMEAGLVDGRDTSTRKYSLTPVNHEVIGSLYITSKPMFLDSALHRIGVPNRPLSSVSSAAPINRIPLYEPVKAGELRGDVEDLSKSLTGKEASPFIQLLGEVCDDILRPGRR
jgi:hypothetical protein